MELTGISSPYRDHAIEDDIDLLEPRNLPSQRLDGLAPRSTLGFLLRKPSPVRRSQRDLVEPSTSETIALRIASYGCIVRTDQSVDEATYLAGFDSRHGRIVVDNGEIVFYLLLPPERDPIHIRGLNVIVIRLLVLSDPLIVCRSLKSNRGIGRILHSPIQSVVERPYLAFKSVGVLCLLISVQVDTRLVGTNGSGQPAHSGSVTLLGVVKVRFVCSIVDAGGVTYDMT